MQYALGIILIVLFFTPWVLFWIGKDLKEKRIEKWESINTWAIVILILNIAIFSWIRKMGW